MSENSEMPILYRGCLPKTTPLFQRTNVPNAPRMMMWGRIDPTTENGFLRLETAKEMAVLK